MNRSKLHRASSIGGFTILELMIATSVFSIVLLVIAAGILQFSHDYYKGINSSNTQAVARSVMSEVSQSLQFSKSFTVATPSGNVQGYCIDNTEFSYQIGQMVTGSNHGLVEHDNVTGCPSPSLAVGSGTGHELLSGNMRVGQFAISGSNGVYQITISVIFGSDDLLVDKNGTSYASQPSNFDWPSASCSSSMGTQFCAVSNLTTTVTQRLGS